MFGHDLDSSLRPKYVFIHKICSVFTSQHFYGNLDPTNHEAPPQVRISGCSISMETILT